MKKTKFAALLLSGAMAVSVLAGCGGVDKAAVTATFDEQEIVLGVPNFAVRLQQASLDDMYTYYFGQSVWDSDYSGSGETMAEDMKNSVMEAMFELYTLQAHMSDYGVTVSAEEKAAITETAEEFLAANSKEALEELGADQSIVEEYLTLMTIQAKMRQAIMAQADTHVSDEEANTGTYSYVTISKTSYTDENGNSAEYAEEELNLLGKTVGAFLTEAQTGTFEAAAEKYEYTVSTGTFTADDAYLDEDILAALQDLDEGEVSDVIDTENAYYVVRLDAKTDAAATEATKEAMIEERKAEHYEEVLAALEEAHTWEVKEGVWKTVSFDRLFTTAEPADTEEIETTEQ